MANRTIEELEQELAQKAQELATKDKNIRDQNAYITQLEKDRQPAAAAKQNVSGINPSVMSFIENSMRSDAIAKARIEILKTIPAEKYAAVEEDYLKFLQDKMQGDAISVSFAIDAFGLVLGKALMDPTHKINTTQIAAAQPVTQSPIPTITPPVIPQQTPPVMTGKDISYVNGMPAQEPSSIKNTREALARFEDKLKHGGET